MKRTGSRREILRVGTTADQYFHPYGDLQFNPLANPGDPDYGLMYISGGDWGYINGAGAPQGSGNEGQPGQLQRLDTLAGTMLRIDPRSPSQTGGQAGIGDYTIPARNPVRRRQSEHARRNLRVRFSQRSSNGVGHGRRHAVRDERRPRKPRRNRADCSRRQLRLGNARRHVRKRQRPRQRRQRRRGRRVRQQRAQRLGRRFPRPGVSSTRLRNTIMAKGASIAGGFVYSGAESAAASRQVPLWRHRAAAGCSWPTWTRSATSTLPSRTRTCSSQEVQLYTVDENGVETNIDDLRTIVGNSRADLRFGVDSARRDLHHDEDRRLHPQARSASMLSTSSY